jgi:hypothetical protein
VTEGLPWAGLRGSSPSPNMSGAAGQHVSAGNAFADGMRACLAAQRPAGPAGA